MLDFVLSILGLNWSPLHFSSPKMAAPAPMPVTDTAADKQAQSNAARSAAVEAAQGGRRSTTFAGNTLTDEDFLGNITSKGTPKKKTGASEALGVM